MPPIAPASRAPAEEAILGFNAAEQQVFRAAGTEDEGFDPGDLHEGLRLPRMEL